ncbi:hypothetical protein SDC9_179731 [bioreactor metagenome]|uniref:Uncharacterized protein n=1 Tax=bioreactor metagenome TaxID=1076179 RepID=A0A645GZM1_9ZZZZ
MLSISQSCSAASSPDSRSRSCCLGTGQDPGTGYSRTSSPSARSATANSSSYRLPPLARSLRQRAKPIRCFILASASRRAAQRPRCHLLPHLCSRRMTTILLARGSGHADSEALARIAIDSRSHVTPHSVTSPGRE